MHILALIASRDVTRRKKPEKNRPFYDLDFKIEQLETIHSPNNENAMGLVYSKFLTDKQQKYKKIMSKSNRNLHKDSMI